MLFFVNVLFDIKEHAMLHNHHFVYKIINYMNELENNLSRNMMVINKFGLHARPAAKVAGFAATAKSNVWLIKNGEKVDASSIIDLLSLCCTQGTKVTLRIDNPEDKVILNKIADLFEKGFQEQ
jgi:phosphocarrier protein HPr